MSVLDDKGVAMIIDDARAFNYLHDNEQLIGYTCTADAVRFYTDALIRMADTVKLFTSRAVQSNDVVRMKVLAQLRAMVTP
jgi:hypothetical protein